MVDSSGPLPGTVVSVVERLRSGRRVVIESFASRVTTFAEALRCFREDADASSVYVLKLLEAIPGLGKVRSRRCLDEMNLSHFTRLMDLGGDDADMLDTLVNKATA